jgi:hypothetical protein
MGQYDYPPHQSVGAQHSMPASAHGQGNGHDSALIAELRDSAYSFRRLYEQEQERNSILSKISHFPEQFRAGIVAYPDRKPFPMTLRDTLQGDSRAPFALTTASARCSFNVDVDQPTFLSAISFAGVWTAHTTPAFVGLYFPFKLPREQYFPAGGITPAKSFRFRIQTASDDRHWQAAGPNAGAAWRDSADLDDKGFYYFPIEYEFNRNDVILVEVEPFAANAEGQTSQLFSTLHVYKMVNAQARYTP